MSTIIRIECGQKVLINFPYLWVFYTTMGRKAFLDVRSQKGKVKIRNIQAD